MRTKKTIFAVALVTVLFMWPPPAPAEQIATIRVSDLRMRSGPGPDYRIVRFLPKGARIIILAAKNGWLKIEYKGNLGYILEKTDFFDITLTGKAPERQAKLALKDSKPNAETIKVELLRVQTEIADIARRERKVLDEFNAADKALNNARRRVRLARNSLTKMDKEIEAVQQRTNTMEKEIADGERYAAKRLIALYKMDWLGKTQLLATADSFFDFVTRKAALKNILTRDEALLATLHRKKTELALSLNQLNTRKAEKHALEIALRRQVSDLSTQQDKRRKLLKTIQSKKSLELAAIEALHRAAKELDAAIENIEPAPAKARFTEKTMADRPFADYKGLLSWPVKGKITSFFGPYRDKKFAITNFRSGINIQAERGEPIRSVLSGHVIFSNWFKGFGNMMIVDHGNHYYTVYAHLEEVFKVKGDRVDQDEVIATVGDSGSIDGPALHFEVRHHGKPVDPLIWIKKG